MNRALALFILLLSVGRLPSFSFRWTLYEVSRSYPPFSCNVLPFLSWPLSSLSLVVFSPSDLRAPLPFPFDFFSTSSFWTGRFYLLSCSALFLIFYPMRVLAMESQEWMSFVRLCACVSDMRLAEDSFPSNPNSLLSVLPTLPSPLQPQLAKKNYNSTLANFPSRINAHQQCSVFVPNASSVPSPLRSSAASILRPSG